MIGIWFVNFEYFQRKEYDTLEEAIVGAREAGFEATIINLSDGVIFGAWSPLSGFRSYL
jgi:hypothetical protein